MKAIDVAQDTTGKAHDLLNEGIQAVGLYLRPDRASKAMVDGLHSVGIKCFSVYEKGRPTDASYFSTEQGEHDASAAVAFAATIGQPAGSQIYFAVDFDASDDEIAGVVTDYFTAAHGIVRAANYLCSVYGSGNTCAVLVDAGFAHTGWLAQSKGWGGFHDFEDSAAIVQGPEGTILGMGIDTDNVVDETVVW